MGLRQGDRSNLPEVLRFKCPNITDVPVSLTETLEMLDVYADGIEQVEKL